MKAIHQFFLFLFLFLSLGVSAQESGCLEGLQKVVRSTRAVVQKSKEFAQGDVLYYQGAEGNIEDLSDLKVMSFNTLHLFEHAESIKTLQEGGSAFANHTLANPRKSVWKAEIIEELDLDLVFMQEVESEEALKLFAEKTLKGAYEPLIIESNGLKGIQLGILIKKDLPLDLEVHSFRNLKTGSESAFSRDALTTVIKDRKSNKPLINIINLHLKSMRDRNGDPLSFKRREGEIKALEQVFGEMKNRQGSKAPYMIVGDFNNEFVNAEFDTLRDLGFKDVFDLDSLPPVKDRTTHVFFPNNSEIIYNQLDHIIIDPELQNRNIIMERGVYRYKDGNGKEIPSPPSQKIRDENPSDHYPIWTKISIPALLN